MRWVGKRLAAFPDLTDATLNVFANGFRIAPKRNRMANLPSAMLNQLNPDFGNPIRVTLSEIGYNTLRVNSRGASQQRTTVRLVACGRIGQTNKE
jgi:hypothetical protein